MSIEDYNFYSLIVNIFIAFGTIGAVGLSLFFWYRSNTVNAKGVINFYTTYNTIQNVDVVMVLITNHGVKGFLVNAICCKDQEKSKINIIPPDYSNPQCKRSGEYFTESETANYIFPQNAFVKSFIQTFGLEKLSDEQIENKINDVEFFAVTNLGVNIKIKKSNEFASELVKIKKEIFSVS